MKRIWHSKVKIVFRVRLFHLVKIAKKINHGSKECVFGILY